MKKPRGEFPLIQTTVKAVPDGVQKEIALQAMNPPDVNKTVIKEVSSWEGVSVHEHRFGGVEFRVGRRELGHLHTYFADLPFPRRVRDELIAAGLARPHHVLPDSGWVTVPMRTNTQLTNVIELFRRNYERALSVPSTRSVRDSS